MAARGRIPQCVFGLCVVVVLAGCAAGTPGVIGDETPTPARIAAASGGGSSTVVSLTIATKPAEPTATPSPPPPSPTPTKRAEPTAEPTPRPRPTHTPEAGPTPRPEPPADDGSGLSQVVERGDSGRAEVALTFDAGADRGNAELILDTLRDAGVVASFGITGHWAQENSDLVARMVAEGHMVFNHTWSHRSFTGYSTSDWDEGVLSSDERVGELTETEQEIASATDGYDTKPYFRPPYGDIDDSVLADVASAGYTVTVMWSCDSLGWNGATADEIIARCASAAEPGEIILMHVGAESADAEALPGMIADLQAQGYALVTVEQLLQP